MQRLLRIHVVIVTLLGAAMSSSRAESPRPNVAIFEVDGLTLSMTIDDFRQLYPGAEITEMTAARYCYGEEVRIVSLTRLGAVIRRGSAGPHEFRRAAATTIAIHRPEEVGAAQHLLGHRHPATTRDHYILASNLQAAKAHQEALADLRERTYPRKTHLS